jgi:hypothetical protein
VNVPQCSLGSEASFSDDSNISGPRCALVGAEGPALEMGLEWPGIGLGAGSLTGPVKR